MAEILSDFVGMMVQSKCVQAEVFVDFLLQCASVATLVGLDEIFGGAMEPRTLTTLLPTIVAVLAATPALAAVSATNYCSFGTDQSGLSVETGFPNHANEHFPNVTPREYGNKYFLSGTGSGGYVGEVGVNSWKPSGSNKHQNYYYQYVNSSGVGVYVAHPTALIVAPTASYGVRHYSKIERTGFQTWKFSIVATNGSFAWYPSAHSSTRDSMNYGRAGIYSDSCAVSDQYYSPPSSGTSMRWNDAQNRPINGSWTAWASSNNNATTSDGCTYGTATGSFLSSGSVYTHTYY